MKEDKENTRPKEKRAPGAPLDLRGGGEPERPKDKKETLSKVRLGAGPSRVVGRAASAPGWAPRRFQSSPVPVRSAADPSASAPGRGLWSLFWGWGRAGAGRPG